MTIVRQELVDDGFTHASSVMPLLRESEAESATVTQSLTPSKVSAPPDLPAVVQVAPEIVPLLPRPELSASVEPEPLNE